MIDWLEFARLHRDKYYRISGSPEEFRFWAKLLIDAPYIWGSENLLGTDCSGTVCFPLLQMGYNIRTTADALMRKVFTIEVKDHEEYNSIMVVFYVKDGKAIHVTPVVGRYVVLDATPEGIRLNTAVHVRTTFEATGHQAVWRRLNSGEAAEISDSQEESWDIDPIALLEETNG